MLRLLVLLSGKMALMTNPSGPTQVPLIYGHRGARGEMPENSMAGFVHLEQAGVRAVEIDVQNTCDGVAVVWHDHNLDPAMVRDADGNWLASDATLIVETAFADLRVLDFGGVRAESTQAQRFPKQVKVEGARIASLDDVCVWAKGVDDLVFNVEIKSYADRDDWSASPDALAQSVCDLLQSLGLEAQTIVSSFDWRVLSAMKQRAPQVKRGYLSYLDRPNPPMDPNIIDGSAWVDGIRLGDHNHCLPQAIADVGGAIWAPYFEDLTAEDLETAHRLGLTVNVWTVNAAEDMLRMAEMGVDGIITDYPTMARDLFLSETSKAQNHG